MCMVLENIQARLANTETAMLIKDERKNKEKRQVDLEGTIGIL